ncbi:neprilysin-1-like isoform X2 [Ischnura elegans]|uniref:neprilysin-1-like isoform X2 n=1 Tax=Ischnura elegans TaxID=197161 RepID=UPI001ED87BC8|nr:neprilysin-1-like isoform X2 [Ischnura elegans]
MEAASRKWVPLRRAAAAAGPPARNSRLELLQRASAPARADPWAAPPLLDGAPAALHPATPHPPAHGLVCTTALLCLLLLALFFLVAFVEKRAEVRREGGAGAVPDAGGSRLSPCERPACVLASARLLQRLDPTADPCSDFYQFSCGNYLRSQEVPDDSFHRSMLQEMQEEILAVIKKLIDQPPSDDENEAIRKARKLYASCMDRNFRTSHYKQYEDLPVFSLLSDGELGPWPLLRRAHWDASNFSLHKLLGELAIYQVHTLFEVYVTPDEKNASQYTLQFYKGQPAIETAYYLNASHPDYVRYLRSYRRLLREAVLLLTQGNQDSLHDSEEMLQFEAQFANVTENSKCYTPSFNGTEENVDDSGRMTMEELQEFAPELDWLGMLNHTLYKLEVELPVPLPDMTISFRCRGFLPELARLLESADPRTVSNYLIWRFLFKYMPYLGNKFLQIWMEFRKDVPDMNEDKLYLSRWKQCANIVNEGLGLAVGSLYIKSPYSQDVEERLESMGNKIGYPKYIEDPEALAAEYDELMIMDGNFLQNMLTLKKHEVWKELRKLTRPVDKAKEWLIQPLVVNAFHNPTMNEIIFPLGILRHPMFNPDYPMYLNFANIGIVIGHEITHGFDNHGRRYDKSGNMTNWWSEDMTARFREKATCFAEQYSEFPLEMVGKNVDGNETLGDNICDNAGLRHSWLAYKDWVRDHGPEPPLPGLPYTVDELFFITYGQIWCEVLNKEGYEQYTRDMHSPGRYRTLGVLQNSNDFAEVFNCPLESPMNPSHKCRLWS